MKSIFKKIIFFTLFITSSTQLSAMQNRNQFVNKLEELEAMRNILQTRGGSEQIRIIDQIINLTQQASQLVNHNNEMSQRMDQLEENSTEYNKLQTNISNNNNQIKKIGTQVHQLHEQFGYSNLMHLMQENNQQQIAQMHERQSLFNKITTILAITSICYTAYNWWTNKKKKEEAVDLKADKQENKKQIKIA